MRAGPDALAGRCARPGADPSARRLALPLAGVITIANGGELERLVAVDPADLECSRPTRPVDGAGRPDRLERRSLRARRAEIEALRARYEKLFDRNQPIRDAEEMAQIAERLGRTFEARAFLTVEISARPRTRRPAAETSSG